MMAFFRSFIFYVCMLGSAAVLGPLGMLFVLTPFHIRYQVLTRWARFNLWCLEKLCGLKYEVEGRENIPKGAGIIFCKHQSAWETLALQQFFPPQTWLLKRELLWLPFFGWGLAMLGAIGIDRSSGSDALIKLIKHGRDRLDRGIWLVIFPEGTRVSPGEYKRFHKGGALLAAKTGYPVLPVAHNAGTYWPKNTIVKSPGTIKVSIGPAIPSAELKASEINKRAENWINEATRAIEQEASGDISKPV